MRPYLKCYPDAIFQAPSFYWELEICSFGDSQDESSAYVSFGFAPPAEKKDGAWTNPIGTCLFLK
jgi:E3 ubiquitin-protein ligase HECTD4